MQAKRLANDSVPTIVLISSEGTVVPIIQAFSGSSRSTRMFEIGDVNDDLAEEYLIKMGLPDNLAKAGVSTCIMHVSTTVGIIK